MSLNLAIEEAISNIIHHGYPQNQKGEITLRTSVAPGLLIAQIIDDGISFDQLTLILPKTDNAPRLKFRLLHAHPLYT